MDPSPSPLVNFDFSLIDWKVLLAAGAIVVTVVLAFYFQWWRNRKRLSYDILSNVELVSAEKEVEDKVEILYEGESVKNVQLFVIKLMNDGYLPIKKDEFEKPIRFIFPFARILKAEIEQFYPDNIDIKFAYEENWIEVAPALLNRKDHVQFKIILSGSTQMKIDARIVGVSGVRRDRKKANLVMGTAGFFLGGLTVSAVIGLLPSLTLIGTIATAVLLGGLFFISMSWFSIVIRR